MVCQVFFYVKSDNAKYNISDYVIENNKINYFN